MQIDVQLVQGNMKSLRINGVADAKTISLKFDSRRGASPIVTMVRDMAWDFEIAGQFYPHTGLPYDPVDAVFHLSKDGGGWCCLDGVTYFGCNITANIDAANMPEVIVETMIGDTWTHIVGILDGYPMEEQHND
jgi:hypothetical protein